MSQVVPGPILIAKIKLFHESSFFFLSYLLLFQCNLSTAAKNLTKKKLKSRFFMMSQYIASKHNDFLNLCIENAPGFVDISQLLNK